MLSYEVALWSFPPAVERKGREGELKIYYANVLTANSRHHLLLDQVSLLKPDLIALVEIDGHWARSLDTLQESYPFSKIIPRSDNFGLGLYSKFELRDTKTLYFDGNKIPSISCDISVVGPQNLRFVLTHPLPPGSKPAFNSRNDSLIEMGRYISNYDQPKILVGDLNTAMWSPYYMKMEKLAGLVNTRKGFGLTPTWPSTSFTMIPIDHCLVSPDFTVSEFKIPNTIGSDHLPIFVRLSF